MANTHMGQPPSNHVTLLSEGNGHNDDFIRVNPSGSMGDEFFRPPSGKVLVITDVYWQFSSGPPDSKQTFVIRINDDRAIYESTVILNHQGDGGASEAMTSGFVVSSGSSMEILRIDDIISAVAPKGAPTPPGGRDYSGMAE